MQYKSSATGSRASQDFVPIEQVHDGMLILKDGSLRTILMASSINIVLKSEDEQAAILAQFQHFLNVLDFSIQIFIQSRELDIRPYLALLEERYGVQTGELMKIQVREYIDFVRGFVEGSSIMTKGFYIVIPYSPPVLNAKKGGAISRMMGGAGKEEVTLSTEVFEEYRSQIEQRVSIVVQGLARTGVRVAQLGTEEVIELYYHLFNIGELSRPIPVGEMHKV